MDEKFIKEQVKTHYATIARGGSCCGGEVTQMADQDLTVKAGSASECCCSSVEVNPLVAYDSLDVLPVEGSDLGLGCGMPTRYAALQPGETVLDLGSGAGVDVFLAARQVGPSGKAIGVDMTPEMVARAWENARKHGIENVDFRLSEIEALPLDSASVDVVLSNCVINLVPDKSRVFAEINRVLRTGGRFVISDMVTYGEVPVAIRQDLLLWAGCVAGAMDEEAYYDLIRERGFSDLHIHNRTVYSGDADQAGCSGAEYGIASVTIQATKA